MFDPSSTAVRRFKRIARTARTVAVTYLVVLFIGTHLPAEQVETVTFSDKWLHFGAYLFLTVFVLAGWELTTGRLEPKHYFAVWLAATLFGAFDEVTQTPVGRSCDANDWLADVLGVICGLFVYRAGSHAVRRIAGRPIQPHLSAVPTGAHAAQPPASATSAGPRPIQ